MTYVLPKPTQPGDSSLAGVKRMGARGMNARETPVGWSREWFDNYLPEHYAREKARLSAPGAARRMVMGAYGQQPQEARLCGA